MIKTSYSFNISTCSASKTTRQGERTSWIFVPFLHHFSQVSEFYSQADNCIFVLSKVYIYQKENNSSGLQSQFYNILHLISKGFQNQENRLSLILKSETTYRAVNIDLHRKSIYLSWQISITITEPCYQFIYNNYLGLWHIQIQGVHIEPGC